MSESGRNTSSKLDSGDAPQFASYGMAAKSFLSSEHS